MKAPFVVVTDFFLNQIYNQFFCEDWANDRMTNIWTHRESIFPSKLTGQMASKPGKPWIECWTPRDYLGNIISFTFSQYMSCSCP